MKSRVVFVLVPVFLALAALLFVMVFLNGVASAGQPAWEAFDSRNNREASTTVLAIRAISIPFGIDDVQRLSAGGQVVNVSGHGTCPEGAVTYKLNIMVTQESTRAPATGRTEGACLSGSSITWSAQAALPGPMTFDTGSAMVCGRAVIHSEKQGALTFEWCKPVILE